MDLEQAAALASIGQFVLAAVILILEIMQTERFGKPGARLMMMVLFGGLSLALPGFGIYWFSVIIATSSQGTVAELVIRSTGWAAVLSMAYGIGWCLLVRPPLIRWYSHNNGGAE